MSFKLPAIAATVALMFSGSAQAATLVNQGLNYMSQYNLIVLGSLDSNSEVEGRTFITGDLKGNSSNYFISPGVGATKPGLQVVGSVLGDSKNLNNSSGAEIGGSAVAKLNLNGPGSVVTAGGTINADVGDDVLHANDANIYNTLKTQGDDMAASLQALSTYLATLAPTDTWQAPTNANNNKITFDPVDSTSKIAVYSLSQADFNSFASIQRDFKFNITDFDLVVINVFGTDINMSNTNHFADSDLGGKVIWNFATQSANPLTPNTITFGDRFSGSVLAPWASPDAASYIQGTAVFAGATQRAEIHMGNFNSTYRFGEPPTMAVPEPATWAMMIMGFGAAGSLIRRRRALAA